MFAVSEVAPTKVVTSCVEPQYTVEEPLTKFVPVTDSVKELPPAAIELGLSEPMVGQLTVYGYPGDTPYASWTVMLGDPADAS